MKKNISLKREIVNDDNVLKMNMCKIFIRIFKEKKRRINLEREKKINVLKL
jgi:hypothetical protein